MTLQNLSLRLQLQKVNKVILDTRKVRTRSIANSRQQDSSLGIPSSNLLGILGGQGIVPKAEETTDLIIGDGLAHGNFLRHYGGVVVLDLPDAVFLDVVVGVSCLDNISSCSHCELLFSYDSVLFFVPVVEW